MPLQIYMDVHIPRSITNGLRLRKIDVITAQEDNSHLLPDDKLLIRASELNRVFVSFDDDLLRVANQFLKNGIMFSGLIYTHPLHLSINQCIQDIELIAEVLKPDEIVNQIIFLPL